MQTYYVYAAACAVGVSSTFGSPIGGVLFSIEARPRSALSLCNAAGPRGSAGLREGTNMW